MYYSQTSIVKQLTNTHQTMKMCDFRSRKLEHSGGVCIDAPDSGDVKISEQEGVGGRSRKEV
jgi:hypothetical protein